MTGREQAVKVMFNYSRRVAVPSDSKIFNLQSSRKKDGNSKFLLSFLFKSDWNNPSIKKELVSNPVTTRVIVEV